MRNKPPPLDLIYMRRRAYAVQAGSRRYGPLLFLHDCLQHDRFLSPGSILLSHRGSRFPDWPASDGISDLEWVEANPR